MQGRFRKFWGGLVQARCKGGSGLAWCRPGMAQGRVGSRKVPEVLGWSGAGRVELLGISPELILGAERVVQLVATHLFQILFDKAETCPKPHWLSRFFPTKSCWIHPILGIGPSGSSSQAGGEESPDEGGRRHQGGERSTRSTAHGVPQARRHPNAEIEHMFVRAYLRPEPNGLLRGHSN